MSFFEHARGSLGTRVWFSLVCTRCYERTHGDDFLPTLGPPALRLIDPSAGCCPPSLEEKLGAASGAGGGGGGEGDGKGKDGAKEGDNENEFVRASKEKFSGAQKAIDDNSFFSKLR